MSKPGGKPVLKDNFLVVERASCPFGTGEKPVLKDNFLVVERASCPFLKL
ncbi:MULTISPECIES: hypothetical protein [unclassified Microcoleus]